MLKCNSQFSKILIFPVFLSDSSQTVPSLFFWLKSLSFNRYSHANLFLFCWKECHPAWTKILVMFLSLVFYLENVQYLLHFQKLIMEMMLFMMIKLHAKIFITLRSPCTRSSSSTPSSFNSSSTTSSVTRTDLVWIWTALVQKRTRLVYSVYGRANLPSSFLN